MLREQVLANLPNRQTRRKMNVQTGLQASVLDRLCSVRSRIIFNYQPSCCCHSFQSYRFQTPQPFQCSVECWSQSEFVSHPYIARTISRVMLPPIRWPHCSLSDILLKNAFYQFVIYCDWGGGGGGGLKSSTIPSSLCSAVAPTDA